MSYFWGSHILLRPKFSYFVNGTYNGSTVASKFAGPVCPFSVNFEGQQAIVRAIGQRARLILTPECNDTMILHPANNDSRLHASKDLAKNISIVKLRRIYK